MEQNISKKIFLVNENIICLRSKKLLKTDLKKRKLIALEVVLRLADIFN